MVRLAMEEAHRRNVIATWTRSLPYEPYASIQRAEYWADVERSRAHLLLDSRVRQEVAALSAQMRSRQAHANELYKRYAEVRASIVRQQDYMSVLETASALTGLLESALRVSALVSSTSNATVGGVGLTPEANQSHTIDYTLRELDATGDIRREVETRIRIDVEALRALDIRLEDLFRNAGVPIPDRPPMPVLP